METIAQMEQRRSQIVKQMCAIRSMRRGSVSEQYVPIVRKGKKTGKRRGPYYVLSYWSGKKSVSARLKSPEEVKQARKDAAAHKKFVALCKEFEELTRRLGELERVENAEMEGIKRGLKSRSNRTRK